MSDRKGGKPFRPHQGKSSTFRSYVKAGQPETKEYQTPPSLVGVPKEDPKASEEDSQG